MEMCSTFSLCCTTTHDFYTLFWETKDGGGEMLIVVFGNVMTKFRHACCDVVCVGCVYYGTHL